MIPFELKQLPQWVGFRLVPQEGKKCKKLPINASNGQAASSTDPGTWTTYAEALAGVSKYSLDGVGFVFNGENYFGIDLDHCVENGELNEYATKIVNACASYTEYSPSGTGVHIIGKGSIERAVKTEKIEVYNTGRFFTVTDKPVYPVRPIASINGNLTALVPEFARRKAPSIEERIESITDGNRNNTFMSLAGSMRNKGMTAPEMYALLKPKAMQENFPLEELQGICERAGNYAIVNSGDSFDIETFLKDEQKVEWIVPGAIAKASIGFIAGLPESRKTWIMIDLAVQAAKGDGLWLGKFPVKKSKVLFVDQERAAVESRRRFRAVISASSTSGLALKGQLFIKSGTSIRLNLQDSFEAFKREVYQSRPDLIIIDSFATIHSADENNRQSIQHVLENVKQIRNEIGCTFIFISHENKFAFGNGEDKQEPSIAQMAGSVAIPAVAEFVFTVRKLDTVSSMIYNTKNTLAPSIEPFRVRVMDKDEGAVVEAY